MQGPTTLGRAWKPLQIRFYNFTIQTSDSLSTPRIVWFYRQLIDELYRYFCVNFDALFINDTDYISLMIVHVRSGQEEYTGMIHS